MIDTFDSAKFEAKQRVVRNILLLAFVRAFPEESQFEPASLAEFQAAALWPGSSKAISGQFLVARSIVLFFPEGIR